MANAITPTLALEIIIPGSFVVLQGSPGDGVRNTMDSLPAPCEEEDDDDDDDDDSGSDEDPDSLDDNNNDEDIEDDNDNNNKDEENHAYLSRPLGSFQTPTTTLGALSSFSSAVTVPTTNTTTTIRATMKSASSQQQGEHSNAGVAMIVTDLEDNEDSSTHHCRQRRHQSRPRPNQQRTLLTKDWERQDRERVIIERQDWREAASVAASPESFVHDGRSPFLVVNSPWKSSSVPQLTHPSGEFQQ